MRNPIFHFSKVTEEGDDYEHSGLSHALHQDDNQLALCGINVQDLYATMWESLAEYDGVVSCETCLAQLKARNIVGMYAGPLAFITKATEVDGVVLDSFGWGVFDRTYEDFFAYGLHAPGKVLEVARKLSGNTLAAWSELQTTIYAHWQLTPGNAQQDGPYCWRGWRKTAQSDADLPSLRVVPIEATVLRHEAWPMLAQQDMETEYACRRLRDWYTSSTKLGRPATLDDFDPKDAPGYTLRGITEGQSESTCLEWPTADFEEVMTQLAKWDAAGATNLEISGESFGITKEYLEAGAAKIIRYGISKHGRDVPFHNFLEWYQLKE